MFLAFFGSIIYFSIRSGNKLKEKYRLQELKRLELEASPKYKLDKLKKEYNHLFVYSNEEIKKYSENFKFDDDHMNMVTDLYLIGDLINSDINIDVNNIISTKNYNKLICRNDNIYIKMDTNEIRILSFIGISATNDCGYVFGPWDNDIKSIFVELYKNYYENEVNEKLELINVLESQINFNIEEVKEFYKNN